MKPEVEIYDTTLRDGSQGEGINLSVLDKLRIAERLDNFGVHYIEGGWPGSNPKDCEFFAEAKQRTFKNARLAAFGSTRRKGVAVETDEQVQLLLDAKTPVVTIYGKTWLLHVKEVLRTTPDENLAMISDTIRFLKDHGKFVIYDAEHGFDGFKDNSAYAMAAFLAAEKAGADVLTLCDTNGGSLPGEISKITTAIKAKIKIPLGVHTHDDIGLGVANAMAAVDSGVVHVQGTINGFGERTGNCNLTSLIPNLAIKMQKRCITPESLKGLKDLSQYVNEIANLRPNPRQPWVGSAAFSHKGGTHVNAIQKVVRSYEHCDPALVGNSRDILISDLAGRSNIVLKARDLGIILSNDSPQLKTILARIKELEYQGYEYEAAEGSLAVLIRRTIKEIKAPFHVNAYHVSMRRDHEASICEATIKVQVNNKYAHTVADGEGPVNALDSALRAALAEFYPQVKNISLTDYKVRILDSATGTAAKTRVLIQSTDGREDWGTVGVSSNIIEASLLALTDSMVYRLMRNS